MKITEHHDWLPNLTCWVLQPVLPPGMPRGAVHLGVQQLHPLAGLDQLLLGQLPRPLRLLHHSPQLLQLGLQQVVAPLHDGDVLLQVIVDPDCVVQLDLSVLRIKRMSMREGADVWAHQNCYTKLDAGGEPIMVAQEGPVGCLTMALGQEGFGVVMGH